MTTVAERKSQEQQELLDAKKRARVYAKTVVVPEIKELTDRLPEVLDHVKVVPDDGAVHYRSWCLDLTVDGRHSVLDPSCPYPQIETRRYKIEFKLPGAFGNSSTYCNRKDPSKWMNEVDISVWRLVANWTGHYNPRGSEKFDKISGWHKLQVLRALFEKDVVSDPETHEAALWTLLQFAQDNIGAMNQAQQAALVALRVGQCDDAAKKAL